MSIVQHKQGFTIIEVVLVLAIAGLIFLMVFVALPSLQRSQRDTARRNDMSRVDTALTQYMTNHQSSKNGHLPAEGVWRGNADFSDCGGSACEFIRQYMNSGSGNAATNEFKDPDGAYYNLVITANFTTEDMHPANYILDTAANGSLSGDDPETGYTIEGNKAFNDHIIYIVPGGECSGPNVVSAKSASHYAILYRLEGAGVFCIDDQ